MPALNRNDTVLWYERRGEAGPPVVLIHGVGIARGAWRPQVEELSQRFQTLTFDNRGLGQSVPCTGPITIESMADDARALMDEAGWDSAHIVGHSMDGIIAQQLALDHPRRVRSLSLLCTFARGKDAARLTPWVLWMFLRTRIGSRPMRRRAFVEMLWPPSTLAAGNRDAIASQLAPLLGRDLADQPAVVMKQVQALARHDASARLSALGDIPTWVLSAEHDPIAKASYGRQIADAIPGARFGEFANASHAVPLQYPQEINRRLLGCIDAAEASRTCVLDHQGLTARLPQGRP